MIIPVAYEGLFRLSVENEILMVLFVAWIVVLGVFDWKYREAKGWFFIPIYGMIGIGAILDYFSPIGEILFLVSACVTVVLWIFWKILGEKMGEGDFIVLAGVVWVFGWIPMAIILPLSFGLSWGFSRITGNRLVPYVTFAALALCMVLPFTLSGWI